MTTADPPPADAAGLTCPLCGYDLRGLADPRCPECGFRFTWAELADEQRNGHRYLFEHAIRYRARAFWRTYWRTCLPRRFWREVSPANPVAAGRVLFYWLAATAIPMVVPIGLLAASLVSVYRVSLLGRATYTPVPGYTATETAAELDYEYPLPPSAAFFRHAWTNGAGENRPSIYTAAVVIGVWPWLTMAALLLFRASMRRARVDHRHLLRVAAYGGDFALLMGAITAGLVAAVRYAPGLADWVDDRPSHTAVPMAAVVVACAAVATYRLSFAYALYLRFDRPVLTVLASQAIVILFVGVVLVQLA